MAWLRASISGTAVKKMLRRGHIGRGVTDAAKNARDRKVSHSRSRVVGGVLREVEYLHMKQLGGYLKPLPLEPFIRYESRGFSA